MEPEWNTSLYQDDATMLGLRENINYIENKNKIKNLVAEIGYKHILEYMIEDLNSREILSNKDLWILNMADGLEAAYREFLKQNIE